MSYRVRNAIEDIDRAMQTLRHQSQANEAAINLLNNGGTVTKESVRSTLRLQVDQTAAAYTELEAAKASLAAFLKD